MDKNYITPIGFKRLKDELKHLRTKERPELTEIINWAAGNGDRSENGDYIYGKKRLREIDKRMRFLSKAIESAEVVDPAMIRSDTVRFGATVTIEDQDGNQKIYSIVGKDEIDASRGRISWQSPLARALLKRKVGDFVSFESPSGEQEIEIISLEYKSIEY